MLILLLIRCALPKQPLCLRWKNKNTQRRQRWLCVLLPDTGISLGLQTCANLSARASCLWRSKGLCRINLFTQAVCDRCPEEKPNRKGTNALNKLLAWLSETAELVQSSKRSINHLAIHPEEIGWLPYLLIGDQVMKWASKCYDKINACQNSRPGMWTCLWIHDLFIGFIVSFFFATRILSWRVQAPKTPKRNNMIQDDTQDDTICTF